MKCRRCNSAALDGGKHCGPCLSLERDRRKLPRTPKRVRCLACGADTADGVCVFCPAPERRYDVETEIGL